ncbi:MAG: serine hydrolase domain-containing protein [Rhodospirillaceae bacterium]
MPIPAPITSAGLAAAVGLILVGTAVPVRAADALETMFKRFVAREQLPGAVLLVSGPSGRRVLTAGVADRKTRAPVVADTRFYVASVGKVPLAVMVLQQAGEGLYALEDKVAPLVADLPRVEKVANLDRASVAQLLNHTSGLPEYFTDAFEAAQAEMPDKVWSPASALRFAAGQPATGRVGTKYEYTNTNYMLLGHVVEQADHGSLAESFQRRIFERAGMGESTVGAEASDPTLAHGYADPEDEGVLQDVSLAAWNSPLGDGALVTTAGDLERFLFAAFRDGKLLLPALLKRMKAPTPLEPTYGFGLSLYEDANGHCLYHSGHVDGFNAEIAYYVEQQTAIVFMTNGEGAVSESVADEAVNKAAAIIIGGE